MKQEVITDRVQSVINKSNVNYRQFAIFIGVDPSNFQKKMRGQQPWTTGDLKKMNLAGIGNDWLIDGAGEVPTIDTIKPPAVDAAPKRPSYSGLEEIVERLSESRVPINKKGVPYYNYDFQMGFDPHMLDNRTNADAIFDIEPYNNCTCWCNARGDSMRPTISSGDMVALRRIEDWSYLINDEIYAIITDNGLRTIKRLRDKGDSVILIPDNKEYEQQEISKKNIMHIFIVEGTLKQY